LELGPYREEAFSAERLAEVERGWFAYREEIMGEPTDRAIGRGLWRFETDGEPEAEEDRILFLAAAPAERARAGCTRRPPDVEDINDGTEPTDTAAVELHERVQATLTGTPH
jgi:hypothetical protein